MASPVRAHPRHSMCKWHTGQVCSVSTAALWHWAWGCQQGIASGFHSDLGGHPALGLPCSQTCLPIPQGAGPAGPVRQGVSLGQEVFLRPLPAPSVCSFHFLSARPGAACAWLIPRECPQAARAGSEQPRIEGRPGTRLKLVAHGPGTAAHGSGRGLGVLSGSVSAPRFTALALRRARCFGPAAAAAAVPVPVAMAALLMAHRLLLPLHHS